MPKRIIITAKGGQTREVTAKGGGARVVTAKGSGR